MPNRFDRSQKDRSTNTYDIEEFSPSGEKTDIADNILQPVNGRGSCEKNARKIGITLRPNARSSNILVSVRIRNAASVDFYYTYGALVSPTSQVCCMIIMS